MLVGLTMEVTNKWLRFIPWALSDIQAALPQIYIYDQSIGTALTLSPPVSAKQTDVGPDHKSNKPRWASEAY